MNFHEEMYSKSSRFLKKSPNSTSNLSSKSPVFLQIWTKITGHEKSVCHTLGCETILSAIGRTASTKNLGLEDIGVEVEPESSKIVVNDFDEVQISDNFFSTSQYR